MAARRSDLNIDERQRADLESKRQGASQTQIRTGADDASNYIRSNMSGTSSWTSLLKPEELAIARVSTCLNSCLTGV